MFKKQTSYFSRFGWFGVAAEEVSSPILNDCGAGLCLLRSFISILLFCLFVSHCVCWKGNKLVSQLFKKFFCCHFQHHLRWHDVCICFSGLILVFVRPNMELHPNSESIPLLIDRVSVLIVLISPPFTKWFLTRRWNKLDVNRYFLKESLKDYWFQSLFGVSCDFFKSYFWLFWQCHCF